MVNGKKTLSDSEMLAYSKNRFADRTLRHRVRQLHDQEQTCHDRHQREIFQWKDFMRRSTRTSGAWSTAFADSHPEDWAPFNEEEVEEKAPERQRDGSMSRGAASPGFVSPSSPLRGPQRGARNRDLSAELVRSSTFQSEALSRLQKPWAYTYSVTSYNSVYNDAEQLARGQEKRLYLRRASSSAASANSSSSSSSDQLNDKALLFRSRSSADVFTKDPGFGPSRRPLTGRSTPGMTSLKSRSRDKLTASASVSKDRPKTSVGLVRLKPKVKKSACVDKDEGGVPANVESERDQNDSNGCSDVFVPVSDSGCARVFDSNPDNVTSVGDDSVKIKCDRAVSLTESLFIDRDKLPVLGKEVNGTIPDEKRNVVALSDRGPQTKAGERTFSPTAATGSEGKAQTRASAVCAENDRNGSGVSADDADQTHSTGSVNTSCQGEKRRPKGEKVEKRVHIRLAAAAAEKDQVDGGHSAGSPDQSRTLPSSVQDRTAASLSGGLKEDQRLDTARPATAAVAAAPSSAATPTPRHQIGCAESDDGVKRPKSVSYAAHDRRSSETNSPRTFGYLRQRSSVTLASARAGRTWSGPLSRRNSSADVNRRGSFMKIADKLEALRNQYNRRMTISVDDDKEHRQNEVSGSQNEAKAGRNLAANGREISGLSDVKDASVQQRSDDAAAVTGVRKAPESSRWSQSLDKAENRRQDKAEDALPRVVAAKTSPSTQETLPSVKRWNPNSDNKPSEVAVEANPEQSHCHPDHDPDPDPDPEPREVSDAVDVFPSADRSSSPDSDCTVFKGFRIRNYVRPQERYRTDPFMSSRRERSKFRLSLENPVCLSGNRGERKTEMIFPRSSRQKVLQELVERNNQPIQTQDSGVVPPELRAKIDDFFRTIEPYCPKPELSLD